VTLAVNPVPFTKDRLRLDAARETERVTAAIRDTVFKRLRRRGAVLGLSGGIDSSVCAALAARALGPDRVVALLMPETDSAAETTCLGELVAGRLGIRTVLEDITPVLEAAGCYRRRDDAIRQVLPEYGPGWKSKIVLPPATADTLHVFSIVAESPRGQRTRKRLTGEAYLAIVAATNFKQRVRKMMEYHYADLFQAAVVGTPNLLEYDQGFFVKLGDGAADLKPIAHLYKSQVYQLADYLDIPSEIRQRPPTTDTYSLTQSQEEFYFALPIEKLDLCLYGLNHGVAASDVAGAVDLTPEAVERIYRDIRSKRRATTYLHEPPILIEHPSRDVSA
jgi:NAD+ synthase